MEVIPDIEDRADARHDSAALVERRDPSGEIIARRRESGRRAFLQLGASRAAPHSHTGQ